jgi:hypothetical protein
MTPRRARPNRLEELEQPAAKLGMEEAAEAKGGIILIEALDPLELLELEGTTFPTHADETDRRRHFS